MPLFIIYFAHYHEDFRLAELEALSKLENVKITYKSAYSATSPFLLVDIASAQLAAKLIQRGILIRQIIEYWGSQPTYPELFDEIKQQTDRLA
ncbi:hypothetical protein LPJ66_012119, partial [Kickxella alabastrina]